VRACEAVELLAFFTVRTRRPRRSGRTRHNRAPARFIGGRPGS